MDLVRLVENGTYKKEDLNAVNFAFISGMEEARRRLDGMVDEGDFSDEWSPTLAKIQKEIVDAAMESAKEWLYITICEAIVGLLDAQETEEEKGE